MDSLVDLWLCEDSAEYLNNAHDKGYKWKKLMSPISSRLINRIFCKISVAKKQMQSSVDF